MIKPSHQTKLATAFAAIGLLLLACIWLLPAGLTVNDGLSYYGVHWVTAPLFTLALALYAWAMLLVCNRLSAKYSLPIIAKAGIVMAICAVGLILTPYQLSTVLHVLHDSVGATLFGTEMALAAWLTLSSRRVIDGLLLIIQFSAGVVAFLSLPNYLQLELVGQVIFQLAFLSLVYQHLATPSVDEPHALPGPS